MILSRHAPSRALFAASLGLLVGLFTAGCGPSNNNSLTGKVILDDAPVTGGMITLHPQSGGTDLSGRITPDGTFTILGVPAGVFQVAISTDLLNPAFKMKTGYENSTPPPGSPPMQGPPPASGGIEGTYVEIPQQYKTPATSGITWDIQKDGVKKDIKLKK